MIVGVDIDSHKASLCAVPFDGGRPILAEARWRPNNKTGEALAYLDRIPDGLTEATDALAAASPDRFAAEPNVWFLERGFGASRRSDFIMGAFTGAIFVALHTSYPNDRVNLMEAREWKTIVTAVSGIGTTVKGRGNPNAKKEAANEACRALLLLDEVDGSDWGPDALDSFGIAFAGRRLNAAAIGNSQLERTPA